MAESSTYSIRIAGGVDAAVLGSLDALKSRILGTDGVLSGMMTRLTGVVAGVLGGAALVRFGMDALKSADELGKFSQEVGIGVEQLSKLKYAADLADVGDQFRQGMLKFSSAIVDTADRGSKAAQVFTAMGISTTDLNGRLKPTDQLLFEVADKFKGYADGANKANLAQELFGTKNARFIAMLNDGGEAIRAQGQQLELLGGVITPEASAQAQAFNDSLTTLKATATGVATTIAVGILPAFTEMTAEVIKAMTGTNDWKTALENLGTIARGTGLAFGILTEAVALGVDQLMTFLGILETINNSSVLRAGLGLIPNMLWPGKDTESIGSAVDKIFDHIGKLSDKTAERWDKAGERLQKLFDLSNGVAGQPAASGSPAVAPTAKPEAPNPFGLATASKDYIRDLQDQLRLEQDRLNLMRAVAQADFTKTEAEKRDAELALLAREAGLLDEHIAKLRQRRELLADPKARDEFDNAIRSMENRRAGVDVRAVNAQNQPDPRSVAQNLQFAMTQLRQQSQAVGTAIAGLVNNIKGALDGVAGSVGDIIMRTRTMGQVWASAGAQMINAISKMVAEYVAGKLAMMAVDAMVSGRNKANAASQTAASIPAGIAQAGAQGGWAGILIYIGVFAAAMAAITALVAAASGGFQEGGYTGNMSPDQVAGMVHGREYVFDADSTARIGPANLERIRQGNYAPAAASGSSDRSESSRSKNTTIQVAFVNDRQSMRDWAARDGEKVIVDNWRKRGWKPPA